MVAWINANLVQVLFIWAAVTAVLSVINTKVIRPNWPKVGNVIASIVAISPGDIMSVWEEIQGLTGKTSTSKPKDPPATPSAAAA